MILFSFFLLHVYPLCDFQLGCKQVCWLIYVLWKIDLYCRIIQVSFLPAFVILLVSDQVLLVYRKCVIGSGQKVCTSLLNLMHAIHQKQQKTQIAEHGKRHPLCVDKTEDIVLRKTTDQKVVLWHFFKRNKHVFFSRNSVFGFVQHTLKSCFAFDISHFLASALCFKWC